MTFLRACTLSSGATASSRSRKTTSALLLACAFSMKVGLEPGTANSDRFRRAVHLLDDFENSCLSSSRQVSGGNLDARALNRAFILGVVWMKPARSRRYNQTAIRVATRRFFACVGVRAQVHFPTFFTPCCALPGQRMCLPDSTRARIRSSRYVSVNLCRRDVSMPQHLLERAQIRAMGQQMAGEGVAQDMRRNAGFGSSPASISHFLENLGEPRRGSGIRPSLSTRRKQPARGARGLSPWE